MDPGILGFLLFYLESFSICLMKISLPSALFSVFFFNSQTGKFRF